MIQLYRAAPLPSPLSVQLCHTMKYSQMCLSDSAFREECPYNLVNVLLVCLCLSLKLNFHDLYSMGFDKCIESYIYQFHTMQNSMRLTFNVKQPRHSKKNKKNLNNLLRLLQQIANIGILPLLLQTFKNICNIIDPVEVHCIYFTSSLTFL